MGDKTGIEWTDATWNPIRGCSRVSEGCRNCYAETIAARFSNLGAPYHGVADRARTGSKWTGQIMVVEHLIDQPLRWTRPLRIFVNSMSDLFHEGVSDETIARVFDVMARSPRHTFQILTKRAERMQRLMYGPKSHRDWHPKLWHRSVLPNVHLGVSVENQMAADDRIALLRETPAAVRFLSCEPLLEAITPDLTGIDWVICGGESGHGARPMHPDWARGLRDQCEAAAVPFFFKQWGEWAPGGSVKWTDDPFRNQRMCRATYQAGGGVTLFNVGKKNAAPTLDGSEWHQMPRILTVAGATEDG